LGQDKGETPFDAAPLGLYVFIMSSTDLTEVAMSLPLAERVALAQTLWQSIETQAAPLGADDEIRVCDRIVGEEVRVLMVKHLRRHPDFGAERQ
jgi:hypothetical protein